MKRIATLFLVTLVFGICVPVFSAALDAPAQAREGATTEQSLLLAQAEEPVEQPNPPPTPPPDDDTQQPNDPDAPIDPNQETPNVEPDAQDTCRDEIGVLSWILCPIFDLALEGAEFMGDLLIGILEFDPVITDITEQGPTSSGLYEAWGAFRDIANLLLVIAFILVIYLITTGNQAYVVQRMLPRLIIAAIGIQLSFIFSALMVDVGNVLGAGIADLFSSINQRVVENIDFASLDSTAFRGSRLETTLTDSFASGASSITGIVSVVITFALIILFIGSAAFAPFMVVFISGVIGLFVALVILGLRQVAIVVLIVTSPLSFLLAIFPGTQGIFKEWSDNLIKLILIYPLVVLLFSVSGLLSSLALLSSGQQQLGQFMATLLPVVTLFAVPYLFRFAGRIFRGAGGLIQGGGKSLGQSLLGDYNDPGSLRSKARLRSLESRQNRPWLSGKSKTLGKITSQTGLASLGKGKGGRLPFVSPLKNQALITQLGGGLLGEQLNKENRNVLRRLTMGRKATISPDGSDDWNSEEDFRATDPFEYELSQFRKNAPLMEVASEHIAADIGGDLDRGLMHMHGMARQAADGTMPYNVAERAYTRTQDKIKAGQRMWNPMDFEEAFNYTAGNSDSTPRGMYDNFYYDSNSNDPSIPGQAPTELHMKTARKNLAVTQGTLSVQQAGSTFRALSRVAKTPGVIKEAIPEFAEGPNPTYKKSTRRAIDKTLAQVNSIDRDIRSGVEQIGGDPDSEADQDTVLQSLYGKTPSEIVAMRHMLSTYRTVEKQIGFDPEQTPDDDIPTDEYKPPIKSKYSPPSATDF